MSSRSLCVELFTPFLQNERVDDRLLTALRIPLGSPFTGALDKVVDQNQDRVDVYMESAAGLRVFFLLKHAETAFEAAAGDPPQRLRLEQEYRPLLRERVDDKWLEPATFFANFEVLRMLSHLGRYEDSGVVFIYPKKNAALTAADEAIKHMVSKTLAPRVAILYLEALVDRILLAVAGDAALRLYFEGFRERYCPAVTA